MIHTEAYTCTFSPALFSAQAFASVFGLPAYANIILHA